jgi:enoyl-CoA hydratase
MKVGDKKWLTACFEDYIVRAYCIKSQDPNKIHTDKHSANKAGYDFRIVPGLLTASLFGGLLGKLGSGTIHLGQTLKFIKPIFVSERVIAEIELIKIRQDKPILTFKCTCFNSNNEIAIEGEAVVKVNAI